MKSPTGPRQHIILVAGLILVALTIVAKSFDTNGPAWGDSSQSAKRAIHLLG